MIGKSFVKRGLVVSLVSLAAIGMLAVTGSATNGSLRVNNAPGAQFASSTGSGQNGQCDRVGFGNFGPSVATPTNGSAQTVVTIPSYKHPCAGPLIFNSYMMLSGDCVCGVEVRADCVSGCAGSRNGHPGNGVFYFISNTAGGGFHMFPYSGSFPNLAVGIYNIHLQVLGFAGSYGSASIQVQSYAGQTTGGGGIGG